jgi:hypothetical protein
MWWKYVIINKNGKARPVKTIHERGRKDEGE